ncbi:hypothetical protein RND81_12G106300 [Saponaria officinalis]|uniref:Retrovirus-related Pol polyprotein from transposon TNT 1-94-like beta-barrel domain-containing protein n=1 Tax=Saponaria officinalis TaxID=3572 RepID=A0AAW1H911_SAPOF
MCTLPTMTKVTTEMAEYLEAVATQAEERKLFQFLNGLDKSYGILRSNILLMDPLPSVEHTVSLMLQEEMQANNVGGARPPENSALMGRGETEREICIHCGSDNHRSDLFWEVKGYPVGHPKHRKMNYKPGIKTTGTGESGYKQQITYPFSGRQPNFKRNAANTKTDQGDLSAAIGAATQQLENLLRMVPGSGNVSKAGGGSEEELECNFAGMIKQNLQNETGKEWIIDSGASNHMTSKLSMLNNVKELSNKLKINLPDGRYVQVTHKGDVLLDNGLKLADDCGDGKIKGVGKVDSGLYYLRSYRKPGNQGTKGAARTKHNVGHTRMATNTMCRPENNQESMKQTRCNENRLMNATAVDNCSLWHYRLGHTLLSNLKHLTMLRLHYPSNIVCLTCPMARLTKSTFPNRQTSASNPFDLIHMDIWGPYKVACFGKNVSRLTKELDCGSTSTTCED